MAQDLKSKLTYPIGPETGLNKSNTSESARGFKVENLKSFRHKAPCVR